MTDAVAIAEHRIESIGTVDEFVEYATAAYLNGHGGGDPVVPQAHLDRLDRRARAVWHTLRQHEASDA